jgi:hypothetical protein
MDLRNFSDIFATLVCPDNAFWPRWLFILALFSGLKLWGTDKVGI